MNKIFTKKHSQKMPYPFIVEDSYGTKAVYYPWETTALSDFISRDFYKPEIEVAKKLLRKKDTVFDVGANVGLFSVIYSRLVGENGRIFSFEPVPDTHWMFMETLALNRVVNVLPQKIALSDKSGSAIMHTFEQAYSAWSSFGSPVFGDHHPTSSTTVQVSTLDNFCSSKKIRNIDFLKLDVEGFEKQVLEGARKLLSAGRIKYLSFEISKIPLEASGTAPSEIFNLLESFGYKVYSFNSKNKKFEGPILDSTSFYDNYYSSRDDLRRL
jgi:FkbM family methyltransferase